MVGMNTIKSRLQSCMADRIGGDRVIVVCAIGKSVYYQPILRLPLKPESLLLQLINQSCASYLFMIHQNPYQQPKERMGIVWTPKKP